MIDDIRGMFRKQLFERKMIIEIPTGPDRYALVVGLVQGFNNMSDIRNIFTETVFIIGIPTKGMV